MTFRHYDGAARYEYWIFPSIFVEFLERLSNISLFLKSNKINNDFLCLPLELLEPGNFFQCRFFEFEWQEGDKHIRVQCFPWQGNLLSLAISIRFMITFGGVDEKALKNYIWQQVIK